MPLHLPSTGVPRGIELARYSDEKQATDAVSYLAETGFPIEHLSIVGEGVLLVQDSQGRSGPGRAFLEGMSSGVWMGLMVGLLMAILMPGVRLASLLMVVIIASALVFGLIRLATYSLGRKGSGGVVYARRIVATTYVLVAKAEAPRALDLLARRSGGAAPVSAPRRSQPARPLEDELGRPKYGVRRGQDAPDAPASPTPAEPASPASVDETAPGRADGGTGGPK